MTNIFDDPDAVLAKLDRDVAAAQQRAERATEFSDAVHRVRGRARSPRGEVEAEVDSTSRLTDLVLDERAMDLRADVLASLVRATVAAAAQDAADRAVAVADEAYGEGSPISEHLRREFEERRNTAR